MIKVLLEVSLDSWWSTAGPFVRPTRTNPTICRDILDARRDKGPSHAPAEARILVERPSVPYLYAFRNRHIAGWFGKEMKEAAGG